VTRSTGTIVSATVSLGYDVPREDESQKFVPRRARAASPEALQGSTPEALLFDKAEQAESVEKMQERYRQLGKDIEAGKELLKSAESPDEKQELEHRIERLKKRREALAETAKAKEAELED
jgi:hypothetical protein